MGRFKEKMYRFMYGRYGTDDLYKFSMVLFFVLWIIEIIALAIIPDGGVKAIVSVSFSTVSLLLVIWMIFRTMSRDHYKRRRENMIYLNHIN